jgi:regulator of nucleoside diphosphate kinase
MNTRLITFTDYARLNKIIAADKNNNSVSSDLLKKLELLLEKAKKVHSEEIPGNVITMNTKFTIQFMKSGISKTRTIIYPDDKALSSSEENISIYDPLSLSVFGCREKEIIDLFDETGSVKKEIILIEKILFQPESMRLFNL